MCICIQYLFICIYIYIERERTILVNYPMSAVKFSYMAASEKWGVFIMTFVVGKIMIIQRYQVPRNRFSWSNMGGAAGWTLAAFS